MPTNGPPREFFQHAAPRTALTLVGQMRWLGFLVLIPIIVWLRWPSGTAPHRGNGPGNVVTPARLPRDGATLRKVALGYPDAYEEMPWGHHAIKVKGKTFVFLAADRATFSLSAKLPSSAAVAIDLPFASPTEYGLGRSGWVTARLPRGGRLPMAMLKLWIDESYRAIAPKRLVAQLEVDATVTRRRRGRTTAKRKGAL